MSKMCIAMAPAIGEPLADGDESAMVALFVRECLMEVRMTNMFYTLCQSQRWYFEALSIAKTKNQTFRLSELDFTNCPSSAGV